MKAVFFILVALNLIIFGSTVTHQMMVKKDQPIVLNSKKSEPVEVVIPRNTKVVEEVVASGIQGNDPLPKKITRAEPKIDKRNKEKEEELRRKKEKEKSKKKNEIPNNTTVQTIIPNKLCGESVITLPEDVYHRIRGLFSPWSSVAKRIVEKNPNVGKNGHANRRFVVIVPQTTNNKEDIIKLIALGFQPQSMGNLVSLGQFATKEAAQTLQKKVQSSGVNARVMEQIISSATEQPLSIAVYRVTFINLSTSDKQQLSKILQPYGTLQSSPACGKS